MHVLQLLTQQILLLQASSSAAPGDPAESSTLSIMYPPKPTPGQEQWDDMQEGGSSNASDVAGPSTPPGTPDQVRCVSMTTLLAMMLAAQSMGCSVVCCTHLSVEQHDCHC